METVSQSSSLLTLAVSLAPILTLLAALTVFKMKAYQAAVAAFFVALVCALFRFRGALPAVEIPQVVLFGVAFALCPICLVILAALFVYAVTVESGAMEKIRVMLASISGDRRVLALLIVWGFGNFMEGMAGFGTAVAIPAAILVGVGFDPLKSVLMCLVANTVPTAYGSVGVPLMTLAKESGCNLSSLTWTATWLQLPIAAAGPFLVLLTLDGFAGLKGMWRILLAADAAFLVPWLMSARFLGGELPDILGGIGTMAALAAVSGRKGGMNVRECARAWMPFILVVALLAVNAFLPPEVKRYLTPGALILAAGFLGARMQGLGLPRSFKLLFSTARRYFPAFVTICAVLALARVMGEAGMVALIAEALVAAAGSYYPVVSAALGGLGGFVTGSGTSSCVLFGRLQADVAASIAVSPEILAAANVMGAGIGKMICPQSIAIGAAAAGIAGSESVIFRKALPWFLMIILFASVITAVAAFSL